MLDRVKPGRVGGYLLVDGHLSPPLASASNPCPTTLAGGLVAAVTKSVELLAL